jgi:hypothetical protein
LKNSYSFLSLFGEVVHADLKNRNGDLENRGVKITGNRLFRDASNFNGHLFVMFLNFCNISKTFILFALSAS